MRPNVRLIAVTLLVSLTALSGLIGLAGSACAKENKLPYVEANEAGMHVQPWFRNTFLDLAEDMAEAQSEGKRLVVMWEQKGCPYCREMHRVNLRIPDVVDYIKKHFYVVQLNLWGDREVVDVDGERITEKKLGRKHRVQFTPTIQFFSKQPDKDPRTAEVWRLIGYWKPFHFKHTFIYVHEDGFRTEPNFQRWLQVRAREYQKQGKEVKLW